jgi:uncharacterized protein YndB with AHSA1/START domain
VFDAWLDPATLARWLGPGAIAAEIDWLEPTLGGAYRIVMRQPDGTAHVVGGVYREIVRPERLVFTWIWEHAGAAFDDGRQSLVTVTFAARDEGTTEITLRHQRLGRREALDSHRRGWTGCFDKLSMLFARGPAG